MENQVSGMPTRKVLAMAGSFPVTLPFVTDAVQEVWPQIAPVVLAGPAMTTAVAGCLSALAGMVIAWFVRDKAGVGL